LNKYEALDDRMLSPGNKGRQDLVILRHMAQRIHVTLHLLDQPVSKLLPLLYYSEERHRRTHRIAIYQPGELPLTSSIAFVGFVSGKRKPTSPPVVNEIHVVDKKLIAQLVGIPGILSYSSLELRDGNWCNLVLLSDANAKIHVKNTDTHAYAAYQLAPSYYDWIRLHHGIMPRGLACYEMVLQRTRHYIFQGPHQRPTIQEFSYGASSSHSTNDASIVSSKD
jgi:hypothetical protein